MGRIREHFPSLAGLDVKQVDFGGKQGLAADCGPCLWLPTPKLEENPTLSQSRGSKGSPTQPLENEAVSGACGEAVKGVV